MPVELPEVAQAAGSLLVGPGAVPAVGGGESPRRARPLRRKQRRWPRDVAPSSVFLSRPGRRTGVPSARVSLSSTHSSSPASRPGRNRSVNILSGLRRRARAAGAALPRPRAWWGRGDAPHRDLAVGVLWVHAHRRGGGGTAGARPPGGRGPRRARRRPRKPSGCRPYTGAPRAGSAGTGWPRWGPSAPTGSRLSWPLSLVSAMPGADRCAGPAWRPARGEALRLPRERASTAGVHSSLALLRAGLAGLVELARRLAARSSSPRAVTTRSTPSSGASERESQMAWRPAPPGRWPRPRPWGSPRPRLHEALPSRLALLLADQHHVVAEPQPLPGRLRGRSSALPFADEHQSPHAPVHGRAHLGQHLAQALSARLRLVSFHSAHSSSVQPM